MSHEIGLDLTLLFWNNLVSILVLIFIIYLAINYQFILFFITTALSLIVALLFLFQSNKDPITNMGFIKLILLLPLGLGVVIGFICLPESKQQKLLPWFTSYINFAVLTNIFVMIFANDGGTYRGIVSRFVCFFLLIWLLQEMAKVNFQTSKINQNIFTFNSSPLSWIYCHAVYRIALLSLPTFDSTNFLLLEPMSLVVMVVFYQINQKRFPLPFYFGFADTIVVTTLTVLMRYPIPLPFQLKGPYFANLSEYQWDMIFVPIQLVLIGFVVRAIYKNRFESKDLQIVELK
ncbi:hypothetical protein AB3N60_05915 [Leptospira sp. WS39.C2]